MLTRQPDLRLTNTVEVTEKPIFLARAPMLWAPIGRYDIKNSDGAVVGSVRGRIHCPKCGGELEIGDFRNCPSCGAHARIMLSPITVSYVFEGTDGAVNGVIRNMQRSMEQALNEIESVFDAKGQLIARARRVRRLLWRKIDLKHSGYVMLDPEGKTLVEYHGDEYANDYQLITPSGTVIAHVQKEQGSLVRNPNYNICASQESLDPFLVLVFVVLIDLLNEKLALQRYQAATRGLPAG